MENGYLAEQVTTLAGGALGHSHRLVTAGL
jgi:hypothetical protein